MGNLISRQDTIKYFVELWECIGNINDKEEWEDVCVTTVNEIKSAEPQKKGKWIEHHEPYTWMGYAYWSCSKCNFGEKEENKERSNFCPNCGADMREGVL